MNLHFSKKKVLASARTLKTYNPAHENRNDRIELNPDVKLREGRNYIVTNSYMLGHAF